MGLGIRTIETFVEFFVMDAGIMLGIRYDGHGGSGTNSLAAPCGSVLTIFLLFFSRHPIPLIRVIAGRTIRRRVRRLDVRRQKNKT